MRTAPVTIGMLLLGAAVALVSCGGDDSSTGGAGASGGSGGAGATGGTGGTATGGSAGATGGSSGAGMTDGGADTSTGGASGAGGSAGKGGSSGSGGTGGKGGASGSGAGGSAGKAGSAGAGGSAGSAGMDGSAGSAGSAGTTGDGGASDGNVDGGMCPATQPTVGDSCNVEEDCVYGAVTCSCLDPGPSGIWACNGGPPADAAVDSAAGCPAEAPVPLDPCPDSGPLGPCLYDMGHSVCNCQPGGGWECIRH